MARIICLANSWREGGRCVAGIDPDTGHWIRPVIENGGGIPEETTWVGNRYVQPLDVIDVPLGQPIRHKYQCENRLLLDGDWRVVGNASIEQVAAYVDPTSPFLYTNEYRVDPAMLEARKPDQWRSLQLVRANARFSPHTSQQGRWRAEFADQMGRHYSIKITDPGINASLNEGRKLDGDCLITISMGTPFRTERATQEWCYKLAAGVIRIRG